MTSRNTILGGSRSTRSRSAPVNGPLLTVLALVGVEALSRSAYYLPDPSPVYFAAVVYSASRGGLRHGLASAALALLYAGYIGSMPYVPGQLFHLTEENLRRLLVLATTLPVVAVMVGRLKDRLASGKNAEDRPAG